MGEKIPEDLFPRGYGRVWSEPLARGRWARFKQRMREPATSFDWAIAVSVCGGAFIVISLVLALLP